MGVYLPNVDMPKGDKVLTVQICPDGSIWQQYRGTVPNAKAVPVPPHGDLVDRREAIIDANERAYDFWLSDDEVNSTIQFLNEQAAVIPAEEETT